MPNRRHRERHKVGSIAWLRAAVLGANDGIVSTSCLILGVAASNMSHQNILTVGIAGLVAGAMSMATGEYVSVSSQSDTEAAALAEEKAEIEADYNSEQRELMAIYVRRGLTPALASSVATQLMAHDALGAHARDELGISEELAARPLQAAIASACSYAVGAALPLLIVVMVAGPQLITAVIIASLFFLALLGGLAAYVGGASVRAGAMRVTFWSALAMGVTAGIGALVGAATA
ncbi:MAG: VIT family protein [Pseudomonadota bacterium]